MSALSLGIMTRHVERASLAEVAAAIAGYGLTAVQLTLESAGLEPIPAVLDRPTAQRIGATLRDAGLTVAAVSGTFNVLDPDLARRRDYLDRFARLCDALPWLGASVVTTCTGTRDPHSMWAPHPANGEPAAWDELVEQTGKMVGMAARAGVTMAFEPETANVASSPAKAQRLLETINSPHLGITLDPANFFRPADLPRMREVLTDGLRRLGPTIALAHAKDVLPPGPGEDHCRYAAAGQGRLDYPLYLRLLRETGYRGALIMHSLDEADIPAAVAHLHRAMA